MADGMHPRCPFYPESCEVERHANMAHRWKVDRSAKKVAEEAVRPILHAKRVTNSENVTNIGVTNAPSVTNKAKADAALSEPQKMRGASGAASSQPKTAAERQAASRAGRKDAYNASQRELMAKRRMAEKMAAKKA